MLSSHKLSLNFINNGNEKSQVAGENVKASLSSMAGNSEQKQQQEMRRVPLPRWNHQPAEAHLSLSPPPPPPPPARPALHDAAASSGDVRRS
ncbi:hypothetical protein ACLB2K_070860 [Fragaria x ananassa]